MHLTYDEMTPANESSGNFHTAGLLSKLENIGENERHHKFQTGQRSQKPLYSYS